MHTMLLMDRDRFNFFENNGDAHNSLRIWDHFYIPRNPSRPSKMKKNTQHFTGNFQRSHFELLMRGFVETEIIRINYPQYCIRTSVLRPILDDHFPFNSELCLQSRPFTAMILLANEFFFCFAVRIYLLTIRERFYFISSFLFFFTKFWC